MFYGFPNSHMFTKISSLPFMRHLTFLLLSFNELSKLVSIPSPETRLDILITFGFSYFLSKK